jgi:hypothetical protein
MDQTDVERHSIDETRAHMTLLAEELARRASLDYVKDRAKGAMAVKSRAAAHSMERHKGMLIGLAGGIAAFLILRHGRWRTLAVRAKPLAVRGVHAAQRGAVAAKAGAARGMVAAKSGAARGVVAAKAGALVAKRGARVAKRGALAAKAGTVSAARHALARREETRAEGWVNSIIAALATVAAYASCAPRLVRRT